MLGEYWAIVCSLLTLSIFIKAVWIVPVAGLLQWILHFGTYVALFNGADTGVGVMDRPPECPTFNEDAQCRLFH